MSEWQEILRQDSDRDEPGADFEEKVFGKIKRKKRQHLVGLAVMALAGVVTLLSLFQLFRPAPRPAMLAGRQVEKKEIPLRDDLFFSASDSRVRYSLEPISYQKKNSGQDAAFNQI